MSRQQIHVQWPGERLCHLNHGYDARFDQEQQSGPVLRLESSQAEALATFLARTSHDEPQFRYMIPDEPTRSRVLPDFFRSAIAVSQQNGEIYTTLAVDGGALWIGPGSQLPLEQIRQAATPLMPSHWDWANLRRCMTLGMHLNRIHQQLVRGQHWYLLAFGVKPPIRNGRVNGTLLRPILSCADFDGLPCYLETFNAKSLAFYKELGFRIAGSGKIPRGGPDFWAMIRIPRRTLL
jgi:hypothetical protein